MEAQDEGNRGAFQSEPREGGKWAADVTYIQVGLLEIESPGSF